MDARQFKIIVIITIVKKEEGLGIIKSEKSLKDFFSRGLKKLKFIMNNEQ